MKAHWIVFLLDHLVAIGCVLVLGLNAYAFEGRPNDLYACLVALWLLIFAGTVFLGQTAMLLLRWRKARSKPALHLILAGGILWLIGLPSLLLLTVKLHFGSFWT